MASKELKNKTILITGGTGSFGQAMTRHLLKHHEPKAVRIFSRDEFKQYQFSRKLQDDRLRFFLGDVRDRDRLRRASQGVDVIFNAAALKQVLSCEYNPFEAIQTNIIGAMNIVDAAIDCGVHKVVNISSDKAVSPVNLYGATKLCAEKVIVHGSSYSGSRSTRFSCVRYGNVVGSRGSVLPLFLEQKPTGRLTITDERMTRFWITLDQAVRFVIQSLDMMAGGEIFVPKLPSMRITELARNVAPEAEIEIVGVRPGEKLHETMIMAEEASHTVEHGDTYIVLPEWFNTNVKRPYGEDPIGGDFFYRSDINDRWLSDDDMQAMIRDYQG